MTEWTIDADSTRHLANVAATTAATSFPPSLTEAELKRAQMELSARIATKRAVPGISRQDHAITAPGRTLMLRLYRPERLGDAPAPCLVLIHGGGWVGGSIAVTDTQAAEFSQRAGVVVASLEYRLSPENQHPAAIDDVLVACRWLKRHGSLYGIDAGRLALGGNSAGGHLAIVAALADPMLDLRLLLLFYPVIAPDFETESYRTLSGAGGSLTRESMQWFWRCYLGDQAPDATSVPAMATDAALKALPPVFIANAGLDPLRDEGEAFAERLKGLGVPVEHVCPPTLLHGYVGLVQVSAAAAEIFDQAAAALARALAPPARDWTSPFDGAWVAEAGGGIASPRVVDGRVHWLNSRPHEGGRVAVICDGVDLAPGFDARSRVHEYGGGAYLATSSAVYAVAKTDQRIWRRGAEPVAITPAGDKRYADLRALPDGTLVAVCEDHSGTGEPANRLVAINPVTGAERVLWAASDFVAAPRPSPDGTLLAFLAWDHPHLPWDSARLVLAPIMAEGLGPTTVIAGGHGTSVVEPVWTPDGDLVFLHDPKGWWNPHLWRAGAVQPLWQGPLEFGQPHWTFDPATLAPLADGSLAAIVAERGSRHLVRIAAGVLTRVPLPGVDRVDAVVADGLDLILQVGSVDRPDRLIRLAADGAVTEIITAGAGVPATWAPRVETIDVPRPDGSTIEVTLYWPANPHAPADPGPRPLIVQIHGGPTSAALPRYRPEYLFWTSRGYVVADVNYAGSTGRGRVERERLYGTWGVADVEDCGTVAEALIRGGQIDPTRTIVRGGSAGGFTVLMALAAGRGFATGSCWYGVSDLAALAADTHKFEARYCDQLIGPWPAATAVYTERSPITHAGRITQPTIFLQGLDDKVVPPAQTELMVAALAARGVPVAAHYYTGEGHGFRRAETIAAALEAEHAFFRRA